MQVAPYIPRQERIKKAYQEIADKLGITPEQVRALQLKSNYPFFLGELHYGVMEGKFTLDYLLRPFDGIMPEPYPQREGSLDQQLTDKMDEKNYELKSIIEVGDEIESEETKTYCFSEKQYLTKGNRYKILDLKDDRNGFCDFTAVTTTDIPEERNCCGVHSIHKLYRNGELIWKYWTDEEEKALAEREAANSDMCN